ncbi:MAG TPA: putative peptidoglycan glycosyltransferase FtsW [Candidatus Paceibacterota bacterium]
MAIFSFKRKRNEKPDYLFLFAFGALLIFGLVVLSSASSDLGKIKFNDTYYYLKHQIIYGLSFGLLGFFITYNTYYKHYKKIALPLLILSILVLGVVLFTPLGKAFGGSTRWLFLGPITIQPSEILKVTFLVYLATWLSRPGADRKNNIMNGFLPFLLMAGLVAVLLILEPATSTVFIILCSALIVYFMSGAKFIYIVLTLLIGAIALAGLIYVTPYRFERFTSFFSPNQDLEGGGFHSNQALITIGSGGLTGVGYGQSANKYNYLPESIGDSIFAIIAEEFGFIGAASLIFVFFVLLLRGFFIARGVRDEFGKLLMIGLLSEIGIQAFINIGAISGLLPITGVTLPFISYGGTSLAVLMTTVGIMANVSKYA